MGRFRSLGGRPRKARSDALTARDWSEIKTTVPRRVRGSALFALCESTTRPHYCQPGRVNTCLYDEGTSRGAPVGWIAQRTEYIGMVIIAHRLLTSTAHRDLYTG